MIKKLSFILLMFFSQMHVEAAVLWETNLDSNPDWTDTQPIGSDKSCYEFYGTNCGNIPTGFSGFYNGANFCDGSADEPGNNNFYINTSPGYPNETGNTSRGGSGKSITYWQESCSAIFQNSDGQLTKLLTGEYDDIYLRFFIRFKPNFELKDTGADQMFQFKLFHIQSYDTGSPHAYFENGEVGNRPIVSGGLQAYGQNLQLYAVARCVGTYTCYGDILWPVSTISESRQTGGLLDGDWHCMEYRARLNTGIGTADGLVSAYLDGNLLGYVNGYEGNAIEFNDSSLRGIQKFRYITIGGNAYNQWDTSCSNTADCEQWYAIDDIVVSTTYVGPSYVIDGATYDSPIVTILTESQSTTSDTITILGTLTTDSTLTGSGVEVNGVTATANDGTFDESVEAWTALGVTLSIGANTITATGTDSETEIDTDTVSITRTAPAPFTLKTHGNVNFKNTTLH